ncbi:MAG: glycoside hydrolase family protein [Roseburia sp.]|nr:glycoside hydrolase family protein [Roseburia sp.]MCM1419964.1 glycoside hydrolase family protein [Bacteroides sp.]
MRHLMAAFALTSMSMAYAANPVKSVAQVESAVTIDEAVDYHISGTAPFAVAGSVDLTNPEAVLVFDGLKPSQVLASCLPHIFINGEAAVDKVNCRIGIYENGCVVYPHPDTSYEEALTVYTDAGFTGESRQGFIPYTKYTSLGDFLDNIESFKLKRGYMVTMACNTDGTGYSRVFIAQDEDLEVDLNVVQNGAYLKNRIGFIRVFPWNKVTKKGNAGGDGGQLAALNVTWYYDWNNTTPSSRDYEYIPHHHHEGWPAWSSINSRNDVNTFLGNNEPNNQSDSKEQYIEVGDIESTFFGENGSWQNNAYSGGFRVGSPAMTSGNSRSSWLTTFMSLAEKYNCRIDFICDHYYVHNNGGNYSWNVNANASTYGGRPTWITEWNYGANWTTSGESWPTSDMSASDANQTTLKNALQDILANGLEPNDNCERYAIYNWVQDARAVYLSGKLTKGGEYYAALKSKPAYTNGGGYVPKWNHWAPQDLTLEYKSTTKRATLSWKHWNGKQTDSIFIERKIAGVDADFVAISKKAMTGLKNLSYTDTLVGKSGLITYRVKNYDSDGKTRTTGEVTVTVGSAMGNEVLQYGRLSISNLNEVSTDFTTTYTETPAVFMGLITNNNSTAYPCNLVTSVAKAKFGYKMLPWLHSGSQTVSAAEEVSFMAMPYGNYTYGTMDIEVGTAKVKGDTLDVVFNKPFPEGVIPVVITELKPTLKTAPIMTKVWDVTNTGFKTTIMYEIGEEKDIRITQNMSYMAVTPGQAYMGDNIMISAGIGENPAYGATYKVETFTREVYDEEGDSIRLDTLRLENPYLFGSLQTYNIEAGTMLRNQRDITVTEDGVEYVTGLRLKRVVDKSAPTTVKDTKNFADTFGWVALSTGNDGGEVGIENVVVAKSENPLAVEVINRCIYVDGEDSFDVYTVSGTKVAANATQEPGIYVVRAGKKTAKVVVR